MAKDTLQAFKDVHKAADSKTADSSKNWVRIPFQVQIGESFSTLKQVSEYVAAIDKKSNNDKFKSWSDGHVANMKEIISNREFKDITVEDDSLLTRGGYYKDTRLGANEAMNTIWQFNRDDDIVHRVLYNGACGCGMGRVYANTIYKNQSVAFFTFGVPIFTNLSEFFNKAFDTKLIRYNAVGYGDPKEVGDTLSFVTGGLIALVTIPLLPLKWVWDFMHKGQQYTVSQFYDLRGNMPQYYGYVNSMIASWLTNSGTMSKDGGDGIGGTSNLAINAIGRNIIEMITRRSANTTDPSKAVDFAKRFEADARQLAQTNTEQYREGSSIIGNIFNTLWANLSNGFTTTAMGATQFIGFRIEKSTDANESWSNSTTPNSIAEQINSKIASTTEAANNFGAAAGDFSGFTGGEGATGALTNAIGGILKGFTGFMEGVSQMFGIDNLAALALSGAFIDIPEQYKSSDFSKSHSLSFQLRSPYGDVASIYQSIMVPLFCLMAGALPRGAGMHAYMQPFLCRVYCKGLFSIPLGIIDSLTVKRGSSEFGWTYNNLPTCVDVTVSIKDLSPALYMGMAYGGQAGDGTTKNPFAVNSNFDEYLLTLAGCGLYERVNRWEKVKRAASYTFMNLVNRTLNPTAWGASLGGSVIPSFVGSFVSGIGDYTNR